MNTPKEETCPSTTSRESRQRFALGHVTFTADSTHSPMLLLAIRSSQRGAEASAAHVKAAKAPTPCGEALQKPRGCSARRPVT